MLIVAAVLFFLLVPAAVVGLCRKSAFLSKIGVILLLYFIGILVSNLFIFPVEGLGEKLFPVQDALTSVTVPLALPLILFSCDFRRWPFRTALKSLLVGLVSVVAIVLCGHLIFGPHFGDEAADIAGMTVGVYTGGTPNLAALKLMLGAKESTYLLMNSFDMLICFIYLVFLMSFGIKLFRKIMPAAAKTSQEEEKTDAVLQSVAMSEDEMYRGIFTKEHFLPTLKALGLALVIVGIGLGLSFLITGGINMIVLILTLTTLSIAASFLPAVRKMAKSYDAGMYLVLIFSLVVASMVDIRSINLAEGAWIFGYICFVIFATLLLQVILGIIFKVDADTTVITSVALIYSPLFVPMIADSMKNRKVIITGIAVGIVGYAVGNYLGVLMASLLG